MVQYLHLLDPEIPIDQMFGVAIKKPISGVDIRPWWLYMGAAVGRWYLFKGKSPSSFHLIGGLEHTFGLFSIYWEFHHPNWLTYV